MVAYYFEAGPRLGLPELFTRDLGNGMLGHHATGSDPANQADKQHHKHLAEREHLEPLPHCAEAHDYTLDELENLLRTRGPIFFYWRKTHGGSSYGHASVIIGTDQQGILYHDPENAPNSKMPVAYFNLVRQRWEYALMQRKAQAK
jgi:hypothetical protein